MYKGTAVNWDNVVFIVCAVIWVAYIFIAAFGDLSSWAM
jgi:hypothetical protein